MNCSYPIFFPDGSVCPPVLTAKETVKLLRLDTVAVKDPESVLGRYRAAGRLKGLQLSKRVFYRLESVLEFIEQQEEAVRR